MSTPVDNPPTFRDEFETLLPCDILADGGDIPSAVHSALLVDCSGSTHNLFVDTEKGLISIFNLLGSFATRVATEMEAVNECGIDLIPFASEYKKYPQQNHEAVQTTYTDASEHALFNHLGEGTNLYDPLESVFDEFLTRANEAATKGMDKHKCVVVIATDGMPTGGIATLNPLRELCTRTFESMQALGYTNKEFSVSFVTVRPDAISDAWHDERGQTIEQWQATADEAEAFYAQLDQELKAEEKIKYNFFSHDTLRSVALEGVQGFLSRQLAKDPLLQN